MLLISKNPWCVRRYTACMNTIKLLVAALIVVLGAQAMAQDDSKSESRDYVFVFIKTGPEDANITGDARSKAFEGHFSNMERMAVEGDLLIAGPFFDPKADPDHRGLWVFDADSLEEGMALGKTDPPTKLGIFVLTGHLFTTDDPLTKLHELDMKALEEQDEDAPPGSNARAYVLATAPFGEDHYRAAQTNESVLIAGKLHGSGDDGADQILLWLDAENGEAAGEIVEQLGGDWTLHGWFGSKSVAQFKQPD
ncbi:MAG: hypothetical protein Phyf2KO_14310 [Phycisphaerales bacterium]